MYKNYKTFSVNLAFGSSWCIFSGLDDETLPVPSVEKNPNSATGSVDKDTVRGFFGA